MVAQIRNIDSTSFFNVEIFFVILSATSVAIGILVCILDYKVGGGILNETAFKLRSRINDLDAEDRGLLDGGEEDDDVEEEVATKVVGEGLVISAPATVSSFLNICSQKNLFHID